METPSPSSNNQQQVSQHPQTSSRQSSFWLWFLPVVGTALFIGFVLPREVAWGNDANSYIGAAAGIAQGYGYRHEPYIDLPEAGVYPPLFSAWLALFWHIGGGFPGNSGWLMAANGITAVGGLIFLALFLRRVGVPLGFGTFSILLLGTSVVLVTLTSQLLSDVFFTSLAFALAWWVATQSATPLRRSHGWWAGIGFLCALLILARSAGIGIVVGLVSAFACNPRNRDLRTAGYLLTPIFIGFLIKRWIASSDAGYGNYVTSRIIELGGFWGYIRLCGLNAVDYLSGRCWVELLLNVPDRISLAKKIAGTTWEPVFRLVSITLGLVIHSLAGFGVWLRRGESFTRGAVWVALVYVAVLVIWPYPLGTRGLLPCLPFILMWVWTGLARIPLGPMNYRFATGCLATFFVVQVVGNAELSRRTCHTTLRNTQDELVAIRAAADWLNSSAPPDTLVAAGRDVPLMHFREYLGRRLLANPISTPIPNAFYDVAPGSQKYRQAAFVLARNPPKAATGYTFELVQDFPPVGIYRVSSSER